MKRITFMLFLSCLLMTVACHVMTSCSNDKEPITSVEETQVIDLTAYDKVVYDNRELLSKWANAKKNALEDGSRAVSSEESECFNELKTNLLPSAASFASELGITKEDLESMMDVTISCNEDYEDAIVALMLFVTTADCARVDEASQSRSGSFKDCFFEATGIAAGADIVGKLAKGSMSKSAIRATLKLIARVGPRNLSMAGVAMMAAEIAWCMW